MSWKLTFNNAIHFDWLDTDQKRICGSRIWTYGLQVRRQGCWPIHQQGAFFVFLYLLANNLPCWSKSFKNSSPENWLKSGWNSFSLKERWRVKLGDSPFFKKLSFSFSEWRLYENNLKACNMKWNEGGWKGCSQLFNKKFLGAVTSARSFHKSIFCMELCMTVYNAKFYIKPISILKEPVKD